MVLTVRSLRRSILSFAEQVDGLGCLRARGPLESLDTERLEDSAQGRISVAGLVCDSEEGLALHVGHGPFFAEVRIAGAIAATERTSWWWLWDRGRARRYRSAANGAGCPMILGFHGDSHVVVVCTFDG